MPLLCLLTCPEHYTHHHHALCICACFCFSSTGLQHDIKKLFYSCDCNSQGFWYSEWICLIQPSEQKLILTEVVWIPTGTQYYITLWDTGPDSIRSWVTIGRVVPLLWICNSLSSLIPRSTNQVSHLLLSFLSPWKKITEKFY